MIKKDKVHVNKKIKTLCDRTAELLNEVKSLSALRMVEVEQGINFDEEVKQFEIFLIERALNRTGGSQIRAAQLLKLKNTTLNAKIKRYQIGL